MKIQIGDIKMEEVTEQEIVIHNKELNRTQKIERSKTSKYLLPCLKSYGATFTAMLESVYKVATGIGDAILINRDIKHEKHLFILLDSSICQAHFVKYLSWIKDQSMYVDDYVYGDIQKSNFHMIIIKFPEKFYHAFETFKIGDYSKMYQLGDIEKYFSKYPNIKGILIKEHEYKIDFAAKLNDKYGTNLLPSDMDGELDFKPTDISEIFNHHLKV